MSKQSFRDPVTGCLLNTDEIDTEIPAARLFFGRKLGYSDEEIRSMWLEDARSPHYLDLSGFDKVMTKAQAERYEMQRLFRSE